MFVNALRLRITNRITKEQYIPVAIPATQQKSRC